MKVSGRRAGVPFGHASRLLMASVGGASSLVMVPWPAVADVALTGLDRLTMKVSLASSSVSPSTGTVIGLRRPARREGQRAGGRGVVAAGGRRPLAVA